MKIDRRLFMSLFLFQTTQKTPPSVAVLETFAVGSKTLAVLVNHGNPDARGEFALWLQNHPTARVRLRNKTSEETDATMFRVRMCFGRGLLLLDRQISVREGDTLALVT